MEKYSLKFEFEFTTKTVCGETNCQANHRISGNFTDIYVVDEITKILTTVCSKYNHVMITAIVDCNYNCISSLSRICKDYAGFSDGDLVIWPSKNAVDSYKIDKIDKKYLKQWYLDTVSRFKIEYTDNPVMN